MLTMVTVVPPAGAYWPALQIPVQMSDGSGRFISKIDGLEPVQATISTTAYNSLDGEFYVGSQVPKRNIVLTVQTELSGAESIAQVRRDLYRYFMPQNSMLLQFDSDDRDPVQAYGYVESFSGDRFSQDPEITISILCPNPNFLAATPIIVNGQSKVGTDPAPESIINPGDRNVGVTISLINNQDVAFEGDIKIHRMVESSPGVYFSEQELYLNDVSINAYMYDESHMWVDTRVGSKKVEIQNQQNERTKNLLGSMREDSVWPVFYPAPNLFRVVTTDTEGWSGHYLDWQLTFVPAFGGI